MENYMAAIIIVGVCMVVLLIGVIRKKSELFINFVLRAVMGTLAIYFNNQFLEYQQWNFGIGINLITVLTSGTLGFPGLVLLYGINLYKVL